MHTPLAPPSRKRLACPEAGPLSQWLHAGMRQTGLAVTLLETRHVRNAFKAMPLKTGFGLKVGATTPRTFGARVRELVDGNMTLTVIAEALLAARTALEREFQSLEKRVRALARADERARLLMTTPGLGRSWL